MIGLKDQNDMCDFKKTGVCAFHDTEVERREDHKKSTRDHVNNIFVIITMVMIGSFSYTAISKSSSDTADIELRETVRELAVTVADLSKTVAYDRGAVAPLVRQLEKFNKNIEDGRVKVIIE